MTARGSGGSGDSMASKRADKRAPSWGLYWVEDPWHSEDWFIVARSKREAERKYEDAEGMNPRTATAELITRLPADATAEERSRFWPSSETLRRCGLVQVPYVPPGDASAKAARQVMGVIEEAWKFGDRIFVAGDIVASVDAERSPAGHGS